MTTVALNDDMIRELLSLGHYRDAKEAVTSILADYLNRQKKQSSLFDQLRLNEQDADDALVDLFERNTDAGRSIHL